jgi:broad specificity phosphatase PhoE
MAPDLTDDDRSDGQPKRRRLVLVRHARSSHEHARWVDAHGFRAWRAAYEAAGIGEHEQPPAELGRLASTAGLVLASDAPRALATARLLVSVSDVRVSPLLRELELDGPGLGRLRLPLRAWALGVGARILGQMMLRRYPSPAEAARIANAAAMLDEHADRHHLVVVVTHGMFRRRLASELERIGWRREAGKRTMEPWSAWMLSRE